MIDKFFGASTPPPRSNPVQAGAFARPYFAAAALIGILAGGFRTNDTALNAARAVEHADALIKALTKATTE